MTDDESPTPAGVLVPTVRGVEPSTLVFTQRAPELDSHPDQMSFPGGRREPVDDDLQATAVRETAEELGLAAEDVVVTEPLCELTTVTGFHVEAYVGSVPPGPYDHCPVEVAEVITVAIPTLLEPDRYECERRDHPERGPVDVHYFDVGEHTVWGATAEILVRYLRRIRDWAPPTL